MKIKADFVTNSSSTSYFVIPVGKDQFEKTKKIIRKNCKDAYTNKRPYPIVLKTIKQLIEYTQEDDYTWIEGIRNYPYRFDCLTEEQFIICKWFIDQYYAVLYAYVPNQKEVSLYQSLRQIGLELHLYLGDDYYVCPMDKPEWKTFLVKEQEERHKRYEQL